MIDTGFLQVVLAAALAIGCAIAGVTATRGHRARFLVPTSGFLLAAIALFGVMPEAAEGIGWLVALAAAGGGYALLHFLDRAGVPVCPSCSHSHGFSAPLVLATTVHAFVDGWGMMTFRTHAIVAALLLHKIPEGLALGAILRMSSQKPQRAIALAILAEAPTILGGMAGLSAAQAKWIDYPLSVVGGAYLFLGLHAARAWVRRSHTHDH